MFRILCGHKYSFWKFLLLEDSCSTVLLVSTVQRESATCIHVSPHVWTSFPFRLHFPGDTSDKELPCQCRRQTQVPSLGWEDPLEEGLATHSSILAWRIPWTEEPGGLQSTGSQRMRPDWSNWASRYPFSSPQGIEQHSLCYSVSSH